MNSTYITINGHNCQVIVDKSIITEYQVKQLTDYTKVELKRHSNGQYGRRPSLRSSTRVNRRTSTQSLDDNLVLNHTNANVLNVVNGSGDERHETCDNSSTKRKSWDLESDQQKRVKGVWSGDSNASCSSDETRNNKENKSSDNSKLPRVLGLPNMGNTCYLNAIIQVLRITPGFRRFVCHLNETIKSHKNGDKLNNSNKQLITCLHDIFNKFGENDVKHTQKMGFDTNEETITALIECEELKDQFEFGQQHDCHEFLNWLVGQLNSYTQRLFPTQVKRETSRWNTYTKNACNKYKKKSSIDLNTLTFQSFNGVMLRTIECCECNTSRAMDDTFADIQIPLCDSDDKRDDQLVPDIEHMESFAEIIHKKDYLKDDNMLDCEMCSKKTMASVVNIIKVAPKVLIIFMKKPFGFTPKITRNSKQPKKLFKVPLKIDYNLDGNVIEYSLYGFIVHTMGSNHNDGHYYAVINVSNDESNVCTRQTNDCLCGHNKLGNKGWIKANDNSIIQFSDARLKALLNDESIASTPYLAFYRRL